MKFLAIAGFMALLVSACNGPQKQQPSADQKAPADTSKVYIPVADYIRSEMNAIDSLPTGILKRVTEGNRTDSAFIKAPEFKQLAAQFLSPELETGKFEKSFTESSFFDESTQLLTFNYLGTDSTSAVKRVDVLISPSLQLDKIKSIFIQKAFKSGDTAISAKLYWKAGASLLMVTEKSLQQKPPMVQQVKVIWDPFEY